MGVLPHLTLLETSEALKNYSSTSSSVKNKLRAQEIVFFIDTWGQRSVSLASLVMDCLRSDAEQ